MSSSSSSSSLSSSSTSNLPVNVVGAGLAGCMAALLLSQQGVPIRLIEYRSDIRKDSTSYKDDVAGHLGKLVISSKRSVNLALSYRGITALKQCGLFNNIQDKLIPMRGRYMHDLQGNLTFQPYGTGDQLEKIPNVSMIFNEKIVRVDSSGEISSSSTKFPAQFTIGADGAYSTIRESMRRVQRMDLHMEYISCGYKELHIPPTSTGDYAITDWQGLHIWPRHDFMMIALPNPDHSFTVTLFAPFNGPDSFETLNTDDEILDYFHRYFPDIISIAPTLLEDYRESPASALITVRCKPWSYANKVVLIGDAAHAVVPFYGQGMNAAFEDCLLFSELFAAHHFHPAATIQAFVDQRTAAGYALADLSLENFIEMRDKTASTGFLIKKKVEKLIHTIYPPYLPKYTMVAFTRIPYDQCRDRAQRQDRMLNLAAAGLALTVVLTTAITGYLSYKKYASWK